MTQPSTMDIHRLLDQAFAGVELTAEVQDLKEEMRADLVARVADLERTGLTPAQAAQQAIATLGDVGSVVAELRGIPYAGTPWTGERVRPRPAYVVRTVVVAVATAVALTVVVLGLLYDRVTLPGLAAAGLGLALGTAILVADGLRQETTGNYPLPRARALGYGLAALAAVAGLATAALWLREARTGFLIGGAVVGLAAVLGVSYLGATQTNRHKPWRVRLQAGEQAAADRFTRDPAAAGRFGIYTVVIWILSLAGFAALTVTAGWAWSWLALVAGLVAFLITLARMLFVPEPTR